MKITVYTIARQSLSILTIVLLSLAQMYAQDFQQYFGTGFNNTFTKVIQDGNNYYVLGQDEPFSGSTLHATVTRLDVNGVHQWTLTLDIGSVWNDAVLTPNGDLMVVGSTLPFDATSKSLIGVVTPTGGGNFSWVQSYDVPGREANFRIVRSPVPQNPAFPYYVLGTQWDASNGSATWDDVILLNLNATGTFNWKKIFPSTADDEFARNLDVMPNGNLIIAGNLETQGVILITDNTGSLFSGATPPGLSFSFADVTTESGGGFYAVGNTFPAFTAYLSKYDMDLVNLWDATISGLTAVSQVWEDQASGGIYVTGRGVFNSQNRAVLLRFVEVANLPVLQWVRYLDNGETSYAGGSTTLLSSSDIAFVDGRIPTSGGLGQLDAFMSVSDVQLNTCMTSEDFVDMETFALLYDGPNVPGIDFYDFPTGTDVFFSAPDWQQEEVCNNDPCQADFIITPVDACGHIQVTNTSTGVLPLTYSWCNGSSSENLDVQLPCGMHTFCLTITDANGCTSSYEEDVNITDNVPPTAVCALPVGVTLDANCTYTLTPEQIDGGSFDNCLIQSLSVSPAILTGCGIFPVTLTVTDWCGNTSTCTTEIQTGEDVPPVIICPSNVTVTAPTPSFCSMVVNGLSLLTATDNCGSPMVAFVVTGSTSASGQNDASGLTYNEGISTITYTATDDCGNTSSCSFTVEVRCTMRSISVSKYNDFDCDGVHDPGESGLSGWIFTLINNTTSQTYTGITGAFGQHTFQNLPSGTFTLTETPRQGWIATNPSSGSMIVTVGTSDVTVEFGNCGVCLPDADPFICGEPLDVLFILDNSGSMDPTEFGNMRTMVTSSIAQIQTAYSNAQYGVIHYSGTCGEKIFMEHDFKQAGAVFPILRRFPPEHNDDLNVALLNTLKALNHLPNVNLRPTPISYLNQRNGSNLWIIVFTDGFQGSSNGGCTTSALLPYTGSIMLKQTKNAKFTVVHLNSNAQGVNSICSAIASPGGTYNGPTDNNGYDSNVPGPRQYIPLFHGNASINILSGVANCDSVPDQCCDSLMVMTTLNSSGGMCCTTVDLKNKVGFPVTKFEAEIINSPGWVYNVSSLAYASGYNWDAPPAGSIISINHTSGQIPLGTTSQALSYCLASTNTSASPSQTVVFRWYAVLPGDSIRRVICTDTLTTSCPNTMGENCVALVDSTMQCNPDNPYEYFFNFTVQNLSGIPMSKVVLENLTPGFGFSECNSSTASTILSIISNPIPLPNGAVSSNLCAKIISPIPILTPQLMCFRIGLYSDSLGCNSSDSICVLLRPCCDPCAMVAATAEQAGFSDSCCYIVDLHRSCGYEIFTKVETEILTPGVVFGAYSLGGPDAGDWFIAPGATSTSVTIGSISGAIQQDLVDDLIQFCLDSITSPNQIPQRIVVRWYTSTPTGDMVLCTDTMILNVPINCEKPCIEGVFSDMLFTWNDGTQSQELSCGAGGVNLGCPYEGEGFTFTGRFHHGDPHVDQKDGTRWDFKRVGSDISYTGSVIANPYFGVDLLPNYFDQPGLYELTLTFEDVDQTCSCTIQFNVDCPNLCNCTALDVFQFGQRVERGFAVVYPDNSCNACFSPLALNDCETVEWFLNSTEEPPIGRSTGRETFCYSFPDDNNYNVIMEVSKKKDDGANCDKQKREKAVQPCLFWPECSDSVFENPSFGEGAVEGDLGVDGRTHAYDRQKGAVANVIRVAQRPESFDGWTIELGGNRETVGILTTIEPVCLERDSGLITVRIAVNDSGVQIAKKAPERPFDKLHMKLFRGDSFDINNCNGIECYELATLSLSALGSGWHEWQIPYNLRNWDAFDQCGGSNAVLVKPAFYVTNGLMDEQGGEETYSFAQLDNFCFGGQLVSVENPVQKQHIRMFPNPTSGELHIQFSAAIPNDGFIQVVDLYGRLVQEKKLETGQSLQTLSVEALSPGIYFVKITERGFPIWIEKVVKQ